MQSNNTNASETTTATDEFTSCEVFYFVVSGVLGSVTILVGFVGNGLAFLVLHKLDRSSVIFFILKALAVVDTVFLGKNSFNAIALIIVVIVVVRADRPQPHHSFPQQSPRARMAARPRR